MAYATQSIYLNQRKAAPMLFMHLAVFKKIRTNRQLEFPEEARKQHIYASVPVHIVTTRWQS